MRPSNNEVPSLSIGTVAKLTGISVHTLRAWEKRHSVVIADRSNTGRRLYHADDVYRLRLVKKLTDNGHSIGNIAPLNNEELESMFSLERQDLSRITVNRPVIDVVLFGEHKLPNIAEKALGSPISIVAQTRDAGELRDLLTDNKHCAVVLFFENIQKHELRLLRQLREGEKNHNYTVVFSLAQREVIEELKSIGVGIIRAPISQDLLIEFLVNRLDRQASPNQKLSDEEIPSHKYSRKQLERLANIPTAIDCECPHHLASLVRELTVFESYCQNCASKNAEDAILHNEIYKITAQARALMERGISVLLEAENLNIDALPEN